MNVPVGGAMGRTGLTQPAAAAEPGGTLLSWRALIGLIGVAFAAVACRQEATVRAGG